MQDFSGKVAVVTGGGSGMGRAFATRFAEEGMKVVLGDIQQDALDATLEDLSAKGHDVRGIRIDVSRPEDIQRLADTALDAFGKVHVVCNNAGVEGYMDGPIWEATDRDWQWTT
ncbi:MAG TPA: SDR family NAD(P)-dependent oxidoreductase, partial [Candidatus Binatia bacterium]|nr:SDR family NAD(P)-dependent oxidoreductase [Candidatus Binatia bacterium]